MPKYVDGFVIPIPKKNLKAYRKLAEVACEVWMDHGALGYYESAGDTLEVPWGLTFLKLCKLKAGETAIFAFIIYKSKADRNRVNKLVHKDERLKCYEGMKMPFDMKRFSSGGFSVLVEHGDSKKTKSTKSSKSAKRNK
jgi:uncharacterized protein YbaA (DUF1428 family)